MLMRYVVIAGFALALAGCGEDMTRSTRHLAPIPPATMALMAAKGLSKDDPILVRAYKKEAELEVWKRGSDGRYAHLKTYPICRWSGQLGPKVREGDRQAPEGFYTVTPAQMNPNSSFYLSFDTGYPNAFDRAHGRTGSHLMVHGSCSSRGCFAMTDEAIAEIYAVAREAFAGGQRGFQFQSLPFRMTAENLAKFRQDAHMPFWKNLKEGNDYFEVTREEPKVAVCGRRYAFGGEDVAAGSCSPQVPAAVAEKQAEDERRVAALVADGVAPVRLVYDDGGGHESFKTAMARTLPASDGAVPMLDFRTGPKLGDVSRPEALAAGPREVALDVGKPKAAAPATALAYTAAKPAPAAVKPERATAAKPTARSEPAPAQVSAPAEERPFYKRMLGTVFGASDGGKADEPVVPQPPAAMPPRRPKVSSQPAKPQAAAPAAERRASLPAWTGLN